jgi:hypothetical protein
MALTKLTTDLIDGSLGADGQVLTTDGSGGVSWADVTLPLAIAGITYPGSTTAADPDGGETITLSGTSFQNGITVSINGISAPTVSFISSSSVTFTTPAISAGDYTLIATNPNGDNVSTIFSYSGVPAWTTAAGSLGTLKEGVAITPINLVASEGSDTIDYSITSGTLPTGLTISTSGSITGTPSGVTADTTYNFTVTATDDEGQATARAFSLTVLDNPFNADIYLNPNALPASGSIIEWANAGTNSHVATVNGSGTMTAGTLNSAKCAISSYGSGSKHFIMNPSGTTGRNTYSDYNTQQSLSYYGFMTYSSTFNGATEYPWIIYFNNGLNVQSTYYYDALTFLVWRAGLTQSKYITANYYNGSTALGGGTTNNTAAYGTYPTWAGVGLTLERNSSGSSYIRLYFNGSKVYTYTMTAGTGGLSSSELLIGGSAYEPYGYGGVYFGHQNFFFNTVKSDSEILAIHNEFKATYGL